MGMAVVVLEIGTWYYFALCIQEKVEREKKYRHRQKYTHDKTSFVQ